MSKERLDEINFEEVWRPINSVIEYYRMDYDETVTIGGQFGILKTEIKKLQQQNKRNQQALINQEKSSDREIERLRKRVQELEDIIYKDERQAVLESVYEENKRYREALEFINEELELVLHSNKGLAEKMFYIENSKRKITEALEGEE